MVIASVEDKGFHFGGRIEGPITDQASDGYHCGGGGVFPDKQADHKSPESHLL